jgi:S-adenosylmethionine decarboxylase
LKALGYHYLAELSGCRHETLVSVELVREIITQAALVAGAEVREVSVHRFSPQGVSGVVVIAESHLSIHTWPEYDYAAIDIFTCGRDTKPEAACEYISEKLEAGTVRQLVVERGIDGPGGVYENRVLADSLSASHHSKA